jgi:hypothetical protein
MASERPICECGHWIINHKSVTPEYTDCNGDGCDCPGYRPAATTPDAAGDAMGCPDCGHEAHGIFCPERTEMSNGDKDICLCEAGYISKYEPKGEENGQN